MTVTPLRPVNAEPDAAVADMIEVAADLLAGAREGRYSSFAVVTVETGTKGIGTHWACRTIDLPALLGQLAVLQHDMIASRGVGPA